LPTAFLRQSFICFFDGAREQGAKPSRFSLPVYRLPKGVLSCMSEALIEVKNLIKSFEGRAVLEGINLTVERGSVFAIMGGSGCGKTTLLRHLIGVIRPDSGQILVGGQDITSFDENLMDGYRRRFGMLFQMGALLNSLSVHDNIALPLREHTELDEKIIGVVVKMKLELVGLRDFEHLKPAQLSGGMQKRVALARALALDPEIVFYDEPTSGLDPVVTGVISQLILDVSKRMGITSVVVTHDISSAFKIADKMVVLFRGRVVAEGTPKEIQQSSDPLVQQFIHGSPDGPIPLRQSSKDYLEDLFDM
jgi:phospholipid/cholesterol/gamma-HCH transport system ATP-binding protein